MAPYWPQHEDFTSALLVPNGNIEGNNPAIAPTNNIDFRKFKRVHERNHVIGHQIVPVRPHIARGASVTATVHHNDRVAGFQRVDLIGPIIGIGEAAVQQDYGRAAAIYRVMDADAVGLDLAIPIGSDRSWRGRQGFPALDRFGGWCGENKK